MDRASEKVPAGALLGAVVLAVGLVLPHSAPRASTPAEGLGLFTPGLGCGPTETPVGVGADGLLTRVQADGAGTSRRREAGKARPATGRQGARKAARPLAAPPRSAGKAPRTEGEPRATVLRSFYTCDAAPASNLAEGTGWRLVGPLRHS